MVFRADLDAIDMKILRELQAEGRITNVELSERVGISAPPCLRRVRKLEEAGVISGYRALINAQALGYDLVAFCMVGLVREAWMVSGESDFLMHCVAKDLASFQNFVVDDLTAAPNVDTVRTMLTIRMVKNEGLVEV
jgi:DNA-binding Lrp family transcriptional regulator